jgi:hypothetical protein
MKKLLALALLAVPARSQDAKPAAATDVLVALKDGSRFRAVLSADAIVVRNEYGEQRIPMRDLRQLKRAGDAEVVVRTDKMQMQGALAAQDFELETSLGRIRVPVAEILALEPGRGLSAFVDDATLALWSFEDGSLADRVKERKIALNDMDVQGEPPALVRKSENGYGEAPADEPLAFANGDFTIEARVWIGATTRSYVTVVAKNDRANAQTRNWCVLVQNNGALYWDSLGVNGSNYMMTGSPAVTLNEWSYIAVVVEPAQSRLTFYVNGKQVQQFSQAFRISPNDGPVFFGASPAAHSWSGAPEKIQFVRLSIRARTAEEIAEWHKALESGSSVGWGAGPRGLLLRDGGFLKAELAFLAGATFRTKFGTLKLSDSAAGQLSLYRFRESELAAVRKEAAALAEQLSDRSIEVREAAQARLLRIGAPAIEIIRPLEADSDEEVRTRVKAILDKLKETGEADRPVADVLRMGDTVLHGWLDLDKVEIKTSFGTFRVGVSGIATIRLGETKKGQTPVLRLRSGETIEGEAAKALVLDLDVEYGRLKVPFKDVTSIAYDGKLWTVKTSKLNATGKIAADGFELVTPAGSITVPMSEIQEYGLPKKPEPIKPQPVEEEIIRPKFREK